MWSNWNSHTLPTGVKTGTTTLEKCLAVSTKLNKCTPCDKPATPGRNTQCVYQKTNARTFRAALFVIAPVWESPKCPSSEGINRMVNIHTMDGTAWAWRKHRGTNNRNGSHEHVGWRKPDIMEHGNLYNFTYRKLNTGKTNLCCWRKGLQDSVRGC